MRAGRSAVNSPVELLVTMPMYVFRFDYAARASARGPCNTRTPRCTPPLEGAVRDELIARNVARLVRVARPRAKQRRPLTTAQANSPPNCCAVPAATRNPRHQPQIY
jgi:hypothetical protein